MCLAIAKINFIMTAPSCLSVLLFRSSGASVTRLVYFENFLVVNFLTKVAKTYGGFLGYLRETSRF